MRVGLHINKKAGAPVGGFAFACANADAFGQKSPIDTYYQETREALTAATRNLANGPGVLFRGLFLSVVSSTEWYIRCALAHCIELCPISTKTARSRTMALGAVTYYTHQNYGLAILESVALSNPKNIKESLKGLTGLHNGNDATPLAAALTEFGKMCQLRHAAVHSAGHVNSENARKTEEQFSNPQRLSLDVVGLQSLVAVCDNLVRELNLHLFEGILTRWANRGMLVWTWGRDKALFEPFYKAFASTYDATAPVRTFNGYQKIRAKLQ